MELVSANTKNFLFLTISQYNEQQELVRAKVSMRRDQPFWQGGNSFIACESFRITSAPSGGGLYYQQVENDFYLGCSVDKTDSAGDWGEKLAFDKPEEKADGDTLVARNVTVLNSTGATIDKHSVECKMRLGIDTLDPRQSRAEDIIPRLGRYFNTSNITQGSKLKLNDGSNWISGYLQDPPATFLTGTGSGPSKLFMPKVRFADPDAVIADLVAGERKFSAILQIYGDNHEVTKSNMFYQAVYDLLARGSYMECTDGLGDPVNLNTLASGAFFKILGPDPLVTSISGLSTAGALNYQVSWARGLRLATGSKIKADMDGDKQKGKVEAVDVNWLTGGRMTDGQPAVFAKVMVSITLKGETAAMASANVMNAGVDDIIKGNFQLSGSQEPFNTQVGSDVTMWVDNWYPSANNAPPPMLTGSTDIRKWKAPASDIFSFTRRATTSGTRIVYTPNEFFYIFNRPENTLPSLPYQLGTDENGGFVVTWKPASDATDYHNFRISKPMCDSLGLLDYMTFDSMSGAGVQKVKRVTVEKHVENDGTFAFHTFSSSVYTVDSSELLEMDGTTPYDPAEPFPGDDMGTPVLDVEGNVLKVLTSVEIDENHEFSDERRIYPQLLVDDDGISYYRYSNLPKQARLGNTASVSVESWGTFSEINLVIPNLPFQPMLGSETDNRILASLRIPFVYGTGNAASGQVSNTTFSYYGDLLYNSDSSRSYLRITTDQQLYDLDVEARLIKRNGEMEIMNIPYKGQFQVKLRMLQTQ